MLYFTYADIFFISSTKLYLYLHNCTPFNKISLICNYIPVIDSLYHSYFSSSSSSSSSSISCLMYLPCINNNDDDHDDKL